MTTSASSRPGWLVPVVVAAVAILAVLIGLVVANLIDRAPGSGSASPSPSADVSVQPSASPSADPAPSETPEPTATDEPEPTPLVEPPDRFLPPGSLARVTSADLPMYEVPTTDSPVVTTLPGDELVAVGFAYFWPWWPNAEPDITWYVVRSLERSDMPPVSSGPFGILPIVGWVDGAALELVDPRCVAEAPSLEILESLLPWEQLACYGDQSLTIEGTFGCSGCIPFTVGEWEPEWLASPHNFNLLSIDASERVGPFELYFRPDAGMPAPGEIVRITGHFADTAASECVMAAGDPATPIPDEAAELYCREHFVVDSYEVIGVDADFPLS